MIADDHSILMGVGMLTKQAIYHQFTSFLGIAVYLFLLFGILALHEAAVSAKNGIEYHFYGFFVINALVFGKVILVADDFHFAEWFKERVPIYSILAKAAAFTILLSIFDIVEEVVVGKFKGKTFAESFPHVGDGSPRAFLYMIIIFAIALIPFFSFRELVEFLASVNCVLCFSHRQSGRNVHSPLSRCGSHRSMVYVYNMFHKFQRDGIWPSWSSTDTPALPAARTDLCRWRL